MGEIKLKKNSERYSMKEVSADMFQFIVRSIYILILPSRLKSRMALMSAGRN